MALVGFCLSFFDMAIGDGLVSYDFLNGADYIKTVNDTSDPAVTNPNFSCKHISTTHHFTGDNATVYTFTCNERDPIWGSLSLAIIWIAGFYFAIFNGPKLGRNNDSCIVWLLQKLVFMILYPFIMLSLKFAAIFTDDEEWKSASMILTGVEGNVEAYYQFVLQLFIIFSRADRQPTIIQFLSLASSLLSMSKAKIESMFSKTPDMSMQDQASYGFYALCMSVYSCGGYALMITTLQWNIILFVPAAIALSIILYCCFGFCFCCTLCCSCCGDALDDALDGLGTCGLCCLVRCCGIDPKEMTKKGKDEPSEVESEKEFEAELSKIQPIATYIVFIITAFSNGIVLTVIAILANFYPETTIWNLWDDSFKLSELAIVDRGYFNIVFGTVILSGILQLILYRFHFMKPKNEEENSKKKPESEEILEEKSEEKSKVKTEEQSKEKYEEKSKEKSEEKFEEKSKE